MVQVKYDAPSDVLSIILAASKVIDPAAVQEVE